MTDLSQYRAAIGSWHNFTVNYFTKSHYYKLLFLRIYYIAMVSCFSARGILYSVLGSIPLNQMVLLSTISLVILGRPCVSVNRSSYNNILRYAMKPYNTLRHIISLIHTLLFRSGNVHPNPGPQVDILRISHLNVRSLTSQKPSEFLPSSDMYTKVSEIFIQQVLEFRSSIITLSETWLDNSITDSDISLRGYTIFRRDRNRHGGGVMMYVDQDLPVKRRYDLEHDSVESVWIELTLPHKLLIVGNYYRPPGATAGSTSDFVKNLQLSLDLAYASNPHGVIILGDFNDNCQTFEGSHEKSELKNHLLQLTQRNGLRQLIKEPTRITPNSASLLDLIFTDCPGYIVDSGVSPPVSDLDHHGVYCSLKLNWRRNPPVERKIYNYSATDFHNLRYALSYAPWHAVDDTIADCDKHADYFTSLYISIIDNIVPNRTIKIKPKDQDWLSAHVRHLIRQRDRCYRRYKLSSTVRNWESLKQARTKVRQAIDLAKNNYYSKLADKLSHPETSAKAYHRICKRFLNGKTYEAIPSLIEGNVVYSDPVSKANLLNDFFAENAHLDSEPEGFALPPVNPIVASRLDIIQFTPVKLYKILKNLNVHKANGPDNISNRILKETAEVMSEPLSYLFNKLMINGVFPENWKKANVIPIHKKAEKYKKENYRPISLLSCMGKVMERVIYNEIYEYCEERNLLTSKNSGFKKGDGTVNRLLALTDAIYRSLGDGTDVLLVFLDITKAFDRVYHRGLINKLEAFGVSGSLLKWLESYLSNRSQRVVINGKDSNWRSINAGVPQGSILGPLLFLIYVNDLVDGLSSDQSMYADDTSLIKPLRNNSDIDCVNADLSYISDWASQWRVNFNPKKTVYMIISKKLHRPPDVELRYNGTPIERVKHHCYLGLWFTETMTWTLHVEKIIARSGHVLTFLKRARKFFSRKTKLIIYKTYLRPLLEYATSVYSCHMNVCQTNAIEDIQRQALIACVDAYKHTSHSKLLHECGVEPLSIRRRYFGLTQLYKIKENLTPPYLKILLPPWVRDLNPYVTRHGDNFRVPHTTKSYVKSSYFWAFPNVWNTLEANLRNNNNDIHAFKRGLKRKFSNSSKLTRLYNSGNDINSVNHARMRMGLSALNAQRHAYGFIPHNNCPMCNNYPEDTMHFFLRCPALAAPRVALLAGVNDILSHLFNQFVADSLMNSSSDLHSLLLRGSELLPLQINTRIFELVHSYIGLSSRFSN